MKKFLAPVFFAILAFSVITLPVSCKKDDDDEPTAGIGTVEIQSPSDGDEVYGIVEVIINVGNTDAVAFVELYVDGSTNPTLMDISAPFAVQWDTDGLQIGSMHTLLAKAVADDGSNVSSDFVAVEIGIDANLPTDGLMAYFPFNGDATDVSGFNLQTQVNGATLTADRDGNPQSAYNFFGGQDISIVDASHFNGMAAYTVGAWVNPSMLGVKQYIFAKTGPNRDIALRITDGDVANMHFQPAGSGLLQCYGGPETVNANEWVHVLGVWTGTHLKIYVNGQLENESDHTGAIVPWSGNYVHIGSIEDQEYFYGAIDEVVIYNRALSDQEIMAVYAN